MNKYNAQWAADYWEMESLHWNFKEAWDAINESSIHVVESNSFILPWQISPPKHQMVNCLMHPRSSGSMIQMIPSLFNQKVLTCNKVVVHSSVIWVLLQSTYSSLQVNILIWSKYMIHCSYCCGEAQWIWESCPIMLVCPPPYPIMQCCHPLSTFDHATPISHHAMLLLILHVWWPYICV